MSSGSVEALEFRPYVFPRKRAPRPRMPELPPLERSDAADALHASRRGLLTALTGGTLSPLGSPPRPDAAHRDPVLTLVHRITHGFSLSEYERAKALGYEAYLEEQLDPLSIDDSAMDVRLARFTTLAQSPKQLYDAYSDGFSTPYFEIKGAAVWRAVSSKRQLFERMVEFWNDHFSIDQNKSDLEWIFLPEHDRDVIRANALGSFPKMLSDCAHSAAMLFYLDNWVNVRGAPQENYARELLELHSLGVHGGYTEADVKEVAKCFTGWTLNQDESSPDWMRARFDPALHEGGKKFLLGHVIPDSPPAASESHSTYAREAQQVLDICAAHPSTAEFLARKLIRWFLTPTPPDELVQQVAETYLATEGDIKSMLRVILARENLRWSSPVLRPKFRRPFHLVATYLRAMQADIVDPNLGLVFYLPTMGHMPFDHVQPNGYPDTVEAWGPLLLPRWDFAAVLFKPTLGYAPEVVGVRFPTWPELKQRLGFSSQADRAGLARRMNERLFGEMLTPFEEDLLQQFIHTRPGAFDIAAMYDSITLAASMPGIQWY